VDVTVAGVEGAAPVVCSRNVVIKPDVAFADAVKKDYDVVVCPGGLKGAEHLAAVSASAFCTINVGQPSLFTKCITLQLFEQFFVVWN